MKTLDLYEILRTTDYPGRGIVAGVNPSGKKIMMAYFIMGRSANSRNRVFAETEDGIETRAADPAKLEDPSLIIYHPVRTIGDEQIVTNGDQTDTIWEGLHCGGTFEGALSTRTFEPDRPNWTPRISAIVDAEGYKMSILKSGDEEGLTCRRYFFDYELIPGVGHFIHTYQGDGNPLPSFAG
ncbi:IMP cyclohydrolase-like protein, partial [gut metagenome]